MNNFSSHLCCRSCHTTHRSPDIARGHQWFYFPAVGSLYSNSRTKKKSFNISNSVSIPITSNQSFSRRLCCHLLRLPLLQVPPKQLKITGGKQAMSSNQGKGFFCKEPTPSPFRERCSQQASQPQPSARVSPPPHDIKIGLNMRN